MRITLLAKRYAQALFDLSLENKVLETVAQDMALVNTVVNENRELKLMLNSPIIETLKKNSILRKIFEGKIDDLSLRFILLIARKGRERYLPYISEAFSDIYKDYKNIVDVMLTTTYTTDKETKNRLLKLMAQITSKNIELEEFIDKELIGGFVFNLEDYQYDASVKTQLKKLRKEFSKNHFIPKY